MALKIVKYIQPNQNVNPKQDFILVIDQSGSMSHVQRTMIETLSKFVESVPCDSTISLCFFEGQGHAETKLNLTVAQALSAVTQYQPCGTTCFSTAFQQIESKANDSVSIVLFTDGKPVVNHSNEKEIALVRASLMKFKSVKRFDIVGFGNYYSQSFLTGISDVVIGTMIHHTNAKNLTDKFKTFIGESMPALVIPTFGKQNILVRNGQATFINSDTVALYNQNEFLVSYDDSSDVNCNKDVQHIVAQAMLRNGDINGVLSATNDKAVIDGVLNAFTRDEKAALLDSLINMASMPTLRFVNGKVDSGYIPSETSPCVMDMVLILERHNAVSLPYSEHVDVYAAKGAKVDKSKEIFIADEPMKCHFDTLSFTKGRLNVSVKGRQKGHVDLNPKTAKRVGLDSVQQCSSFKDFNIIHDGTVNVEKIHLVEPTKELIDELIDNNYIVHSIVGSNDVILSSPSTVFNRAYLKQDVSQDRLNMLCDLKLKELALQARQAVLNKAIETNGIKTGVYASLTDDQIQVLSEHGVNRSRSYVAIGGESPVYTDTISVKSIVVNVKGVSSLPAIDVVNKAIASKKSLTAAQKFVSDAMDLYSTIADYELLLKDVQSELKQVRMQIWIISVITIGNGLTFIGLSDDGKYSYKGFEFTIKPEYKDKKV